MASFDTGFPADSLEFCPSPLASDIVACGTYKLDNDTFSAENERTNQQHRRGQCLIFRVQSNETSDKLSIEKMQECDLAAVLDMKWCHLGETSQPLLAVADSMANITLHQLNTSEKRLSQIERIQCATSDVLCLSLDWSNRLRPQSSPGCLIVSLSNGSLCLLRPTQTSHLALTETWHAHDYEPWIAAWNYWDINIIYSGGDDLRLLAWDIRQGFAKPVHINKRFDAGVTSIQSHPHIENIFAVGSYDHKIRIFDARKPSVPLAQADAGGGVWRLKWHPSSTRRNDVLVASMHDGFKIVSFDLDISIDQLPTGAKFTRRFDEHKSLAYGADWSYAPSGSRGTIIGSCSFYDHTLHLWRG
ncbi:hypothetical protein AGABI1DRAFT_117353 [Agaricus bisporus var. burnettii JB137-S8]|uniref:methylated diphthine methylhydrolase n=1 Tax=Agaricus bisporus var. burnettii (strain JB137-S8 / ATCC MYA-4627 / FGSC 10392) TaxID=597362 RepID=K5WAH3_AGABU|nr:uncharacterized protein AGABI1DRAFT_117353 [Agaricus bisporus var. burnettii JB137-S8]EKM83884.1 hypothetical protein AGABI1DRAFT_117353 [Agaricus bisporus var. burnettii JB137-S8]